MTLIQETYTTIDVINEAFSDYALKIELNDYATTQYEKDTYPLYTYLNKNYTNHTQLVNMLNGYALKTDIPTTVDFNNYVLITDYNILAEKVLALENENAVIKLQIENLYDFVNSFELNIDTKLLTENDLILNYYEEYAIMHFKILNKKLLF